MTIGVWKHVAFTWDRENQIGRLYIDGTMTSKRTVADKSKSADLNPNDHTVYDIGLKRDERADQSSLHGYLRDLIVINRAISDAELKDIVAKSSGGSFIMG